MVVALTRAVPRSIDRCELTHLARTPIDYARAVEQHAAYEDCLRTLGCRVERLPAEDDMPDSVFVEDTAVIFDDFVRTDGVFTIEQAVKRLTHDLATAWNLPDRGLLRPGYAADVVVFDPATIARGPELDVADMPTGCARYFRGSVGIDATVINGGVAWTKSDGYAATLSGAIASRRDR